MTQYIVLKRRAKSDNYKNVGYITLDTYYSKPDKIVKRFGKGNYVLVPTNHWNQVKVDIY